MALILITDNPQGGACRCEGQELDLANLSHEQVEALKQALGISETAGAGVALDINALLKAEIDPNVAFEGLNELINPLIFSSGTLGVEVRTLANALSNTENSIGRLNMESGKFSSQLIGLKHNVENALADINNLRSDINRLRNDDLQSVRRLAEMLAYDLLAKGDILDAQKYMMTYGIG